MFELFEVSLLLLDDRVAFDDLLSALLKLLLHLLDLVFVDSIGVGKLRALLLQRCNERLSLLNQRLLVFYFPLQRLDEDHLLRDGLLLGVFGLIQGLVALPQRFELVLREIEFVLFALNRAVELFDLGVHFPLCVEQRLVGRLQLVKLALQVRVLIFVTRPAVFQLRIKSGLHLGLFKKHLLSDLVDGLLILDSHGILDAAHLLSRLAKITLDLLSLSLKLANLALQACIHRRQVSVRLR